MIIGITGTLGAGKGTVVRHLKKIGFHHYSVRAYLTDEIVKRGLEVNRDNMVTVANELRAQNSPSYLAEQLYEQAKKKGGNCIIESIRTPGEAEALQQKDQFYLIAVDAEQKIRYQRIIKRNSTTDRISMEKFVEDETKEMTSDDPNKQNLSKCITMADFRIDNSGSFEDLYNQIDKITETIKKDDKN